MEIKCKHCNNINTADNWNKETERVYGEGVTSIEIGIKNLNWKYICPSCDQICYLNDREQYSNEHLTLDIATGDKVYINSIELYGVVIGITDTQYQIEVYGNYGIYSALKDDVTKA